MKEPRKLLTRRERAEAGFTLLDLLATVMVGGLLAATLSLGMARTGPHTRAIQCLNNVRQLTGAWSLYATDYSDVVANNYGVVETTTTINAGGFANWANNTLTWGAGTSVADVSNTNVQWLASGGLGKYLGTQLSALSCPADVYLSAIQRAVGWTRRTRSFSMNSVFGRFSGSASDSTASGNNWAFPSYRQYLKQGQVPRPFKTWLLIEEHPDSINDGYFVNNPESNTSWQDIPAAFHNGGTSLAFADLHGEVKKWTSATSRYSAVKFQYYQMSFDAAGRQDYAWYLERTGWVRSSTGQPQFGY